MRLDAQLFAHLVLLYFIFLYVGQDGTGQSAFLGILILGAIGGLAFNGFDFYRIYSHRDEINGGLVHINICSNCKDFQPASSFC